MLSLGISIYLSIIMSFTAFFLLVGQSSLTFKLSQYQMMDLSHGRIPDRQNLFFFFYQSQASWSRSGQRAAVNLSTSLWANQLCPNVK